MAKYVANYDEKFVKSFVLEADEEDAVPAVDGYESAVDLVLAAPVYIQSATGVALVTAATETSLTAGATEYTYGEA